MWHLTHRRFVFTLKATAGRVGRGSTAAAPDLRRRGLRRPVPPRRDSSPRDRPPAHRGTQGPDRPPDRAPLCHAQLDEAATATRRAGGGPSLQGHLSTKGGTSSTTPASSGAAPVLVGDARRPVLDSGASAKRHRTFVLLPIGPLPRWAGWRDSVPGVPFVNHLHL